MLRWRLTLSKKVLRRQKHVLSQRTTPFVCTLTMLAAVDQNNQQGTAGRWEKMFLRLGGSQKGGFQKGGFGGCSPRTKTGTRVRSPKPPFWKPSFYLPMTLFGVDKRVVSKRVVLADVPPERKPERGYVRQNHPFTKPPFYLPVPKAMCISLRTLSY